MDDHDLRLGFRALDEGVLRPDQWLDLLRGRLDGDARPFEEILRARGFDPPDSSIDSERTATARPFHERATAPSDDPPFGDPPEGETAPTQPWPGPEPEAPTGSPPPRYEKIRVLGTGGLGRVWLARDSLLGREVALKELRDDRPAGPGIVRRFLEEAKITSLMEHPAIVPIYDLVEEDGERRLPTYTMRALVGRTLALAVEAYHRRSASKPADPLEFRGLLDALTAVCRAVAYAHSRGVLHRDLKGANVILGDFGEVFVIDWGLAKSSRVASDPEAPPSRLGVWEDAPDETEPGSVLGTAGYIAPEIVRGSSADVRTDVYSLGAILYLILAGRTAYVGRPREILRDVAERDPEPPRSIAPSAPEALEAVCLKAMARDPSARYASASELAEDIRRWLADEPVGPYVEPLPKRLVRRARKHRAAVLTLSAAVVTALVVQSFAYVRLWDQQRKTAAQKVEATRQRGRALTNLEVARQLTLRLLTIADADLAPVPRTERARVRIFDSGQQTFRRFLADQPEDPSLRGWTAQVDRFSANIHRLLDELDVAEPSYLESIALFEGLAADQPADCRHASNLSMALGDLADALARAGRLREAGSKVVRAVEVARATTIRFPGRPEPALALAKALHDQALIEGQGGEPAEAGRLAGRAAGLYDDLIRAPNRGPALTERLMLGWSCRALAEAERELGRPAEAKLAADRGIEAARPLHGGFADHPDVRHLLAALHLERGQALAEADPTEAARDLGDALAAWDRLAVESPANPHHQEWAASARLALGIARADAPDVALGHLDAARKSFEALADRHAGIPGHRLGQARALVEAARIGPPARAADRLDEAIRLLEAIRGRSPEDGRARKLLARAAGRPSASP